VFDKLGKDGFNVEQIWEDIKDSIVKSCLAVEHKIGGFVSRLVPWRCNSFEILGYDYILDTRGKPWLLEINHAPNLEPHTELETSIKRGMIRDSLQIVDVLSEFNAFLNKETARVWAIVQNKCAVAPLCFSLPEH
jgi:tubulin polyglutamylase TTLL6/13